MNRGIGIREGKRWAAAIGRAALLVCLLPGGVSAANVYGLLDQGLVGGFGTHIPAAAKDMRHNWGSGNGRGTRTNYTSRFGIEGSEDLLPGLKIEARLEGTIDPNHAFYFDRHAYLGITGDFGSLRVGRTRDLINGIATRFDPFSNDGLVEDKILLAQMAGVGRFRVANAISYVSPVVQGLQFHAQFALRRTPVDSNAMKLVLTGDQAAWGWHAGIDLPSREHHAGPGGTPLFNFGPDARNLIAGAYRQLGRVRVAGEVLHTTRDMNGAGVDPALPRPVACPWGWIATARMPLTVGEAKLVMVNSDQVFGMNGDWQPIRAIGGGYELFLSKDTMLYLQVGTERKSGGGHWHGGIWKRF